MDHYLPEMDQRTAVVGFGILLIVVCLYWTYGYFRRRSKKRF